MTEKETHEVLISMPSYRGSPEKETNVCLQHCFSYMTHKNVKTAFNPQTGSSIARNRNEGVEEAKKAGAKFLMFIDDDMIFDADWVHRLMNHDKDIVTGLTVKKDYPHTPNVRRLGKDGLLDTTPPLRDGGLVWLDACGTGFLLINMKVFEKIPKPYFCFPPTDKGTVEGEDYYFCSQARKFGFSIWADMDMHVGHLGKYPFSIRDHLNVLAEKTQEYAKENKIQLVH